MVDLDLRSERRDQLAAGLRAELEALIPGSSTGLYGSLATRTADPYSDIDLCWMIADETFPANGLRGRGDVTSGLLSRGYERIGLTPPPDASLTELITTLAESCARLEPGLASMASEVRGVAEALLTAGYGRLRWASPG